MMKCQETRRWCHRMNDSDTDGVIGGRGRHGSCVFVVRSTGNLSRSGFEWGPFQRRGVGYRNVVGIGGLLGHRCEVINALPMVVKW
jgi:hypothetical protein